jgi:hypothetical protein
VSADLPPWAEHAHPAPRAQARLRYVVDLPAWPSARPLLQMALCVVRDAARKATPGGTLHTALAMLAGGRVEEVSR